MNNTENQGTWSEKNPFAFLVAGITLGGLLLSSYYNFLLFHSLAELFSVVIGFGIFMTAWNSRQFLKNDYLMLLGIACFFVSSLDLLHTLAYKGMPIFSGKDPNLATELWIAARYMESISMLVAPFMLRRQLHVERTFLLYAGLTLLLFLSIFTWKIFPNCYVEGVGLTGFKVGSEYAICLILLGATVLLLRHRTAFDPKVLRYLFWSINLTILSELAFTFYVDVYGISNLVGHYCKIASFYLVYKAIIETGLTKPFTLLLRETKQNEERYRLLFDRNPDGVFTVDTTGRFVMVNPACELMSGYTAGKLLEKTFPELCAPDQMARTVAEFQRGITEKASTQLETAFIRKNGERAEVWIAGEPMLAEGKVVGMHCTAKDITARKQAETALQRTKDQLAQANQELEQRVRERTAELREIVAELERYSYSIAHDLRAPLRSMRMFAQLLLTERAQALDTESQTYLQRISEGAKRMDHLVQDVLNYSKVSRAELTQEIVDLEPLVQQIVEQYPGLQPPRAYVQILSPLLPVQGNLALLTQCIANLLDNAAKFVVQGTTPQIRLWTEPRGTMVRVWVEDNGIGIAPKDQERIWEIYQKLHHRTEYEGTGIGLSIVRKAVERMAGTVGVESDLGKGSRFWIELPATPAEKGTEPETAS